MRRRPNADAPSSTDAVEAAAPAETADSIAAPDNLTAADAETAPPSGGEEATAKPRRRAPRRKTADAEVSVAAASEVPAPEAPAELPPAEPTDETSKPKRAPRKRALKADAADAAAPVAAPEVTAEPAPVEIAPVEAEAAPSDVTRPTRRRGGRRTADVPPVEALQEPVAEAAAPAEVAPVETAPNAEETPRPPRRGRTRRTPAGTASAETVSAAETATPVEETPAANLEAAPVSARSRRVRTPRRTAVADIEVPAAPPVAASPPATRRVRGLPRRREAAGGGADAQAVQVVAPFAPVEPLPPTYQALPADVLARLPEVRVVVRKNAAELLINNEARLPFWFFVNLDDEANRDVAVREIRLAYEAGIRFFTLLAHLPWKTRTGERRFGPLDDVLQFVADNAPDALVMPRLIFSPPASWERNNPDEMSRYADDETGDVSLGSRAFWEGEAEDALRAAVEYVAQSDHASRVFGFYLEHGEWFHEKGRGYDDSDANTQGFQAWLKAKYKNANVALRAAWHDGSVTFDKAEVPSFPPPVSSANTVFWSSKETRWADFHEYSSDVVAQVVTRLAKAVKEASGNRSAVAVSYGYTLELARAHSGHLALGTLLASPFVDILTGPISYSNRLPGGSAPLPAPIDSVLLAGKLWVAEDDTKTNLASDETPDSYNPKIANAEGVWAAYTRNFGAALARGTGISWMDLWGEGWMDDRELWEGLGNLKNIAESLANRRRNGRTNPAPEPDVAVVIDERSFFDVRSDDVLAQTIAGVRDTVLRSGARVGFYLLSDLAKKNFPTTPRLLLFLNAFRIPEAVRTAIKERFQNDGRTLAWMFGPGSREDNLTEVSDVVGMQLRLQPWGAKTGTTILSNVRSPLTELFRGQKIGEETRLNPSYYVSDTKAQILGEYAASGSPSLAVKKHARWQSVFIGDRVLPLALLRGLYRLANVPIYTVDDDVAVVGDNVLSLHSAPGGGTVVHLPEEGVLFDLLTGETLATGGYGARLSMPPRGTRILFWGTAGEISRLGGDPNAGLMGLHRDELPPAPPPFVFEGEALASGAIPPPDASAEDVALMEAALAGNFPFVDKDEADDDDYDAPVLPVATAPAAPPVVEGVTAAETAAKKKRRRRRRGGRANAGETDGAASEANDETGDEDANEIAPEESIESAASDADFAIFAPVPVAPDVASAARLLGDLFAPPLAPPGPRERPTLDELLPLSADMPDGETLPPVPDELLPMTDRALTSGDGNDAEPEDAPPVRARRGRPRRPSLPPAAEE